ncbi:MAG: hypothetical protein GXO43_01495 [Crenarchaeota archaeon]|nr:hypothetical protein [Thermoproteota archaeon]
MVGKTLRIVNVYKVGPKKVARISGGLAGIYLPKDLAFLRGKKVMITIEVLEESDD